VWSLERERAELALTLATALAGYWFVRHRFREGMAWLERALETAGGHEEPALRGRALLAKYWLLWPLGRRGESRAVATEALTLFRALDDPVGI
jgi:hypothetical protein